MDIKSYAIGLVMTTAAKITCEFCFVLWRHDPFIYATYNFLIFIPPCSNVTQYPSNLYINMYTNTCVNSYTLKNTYTLSSLRIFLQILPPSPTYSNPVDGDEVPVPHFGLALTKEQFHSLAERIRAAGIQFIIEPHLRFQGQPGEQLTMFFKDPSGNNLEFKTMTKIDNLFAKYNVADE